MRVDISLCKRMARDSMRGRRPGALPVSLVYLLLTSGIVMVVSMVAFQPMMRTVINAAYAELSDWETAQLVLSQLGLWGIALILLCLASFFGAVVQYGYQTYVLDLARGREAGYRNLTSGFAITGRVLGTSIVVGIYSFLWYLAAFVPVWLVGVALRELMPYRLSALAALLTFLLQVGAGVFYASRVLRYALAVLALADDPELKTFGAIRRSKELMKGRRWEFFKLWLSFLGWYLLEALIIYGSIFVSVIILWVSVVAAVLGAGTLDAYQMIGLLMGNLWVVPLVTVFGSYFYLMWLTPYLNTTVAHYYLAISKPPEQSELKPDGGYGPGSGTPPQDLWDRPAGGNGGGNPPDSRSNPELPF